MAYFALLWKARTIQKYKNDYEIEKLDTIILSKKPVEEAFSCQRLWRCRRRFYGIFRKIFPEGSSVYILLKNMNTDQTFPNFVLKSVIGFVGGVVLTYLCFLFFVFQLSISLIHATFMSSILGILLTLGLAFSYRVRCLVFLLIPQFFSRVGRYTLTCYALVLILTGPATNTLRNSEALSECMANGQEQVKSSVRDINEALKNPYNAFKDNMNILITRGKQTADKVTDLVLKINRLALTIASVIQSSFSWLSSVTRSCIKNVQPPYEHCASALKEASLDCQAKYGPWKYWMCDVGYVTKQACEIKVPLKSFCMKIDYVNEGLRNSLKKKLKAFFNRIKAMLSLEVVIHRSYVMSSTGRPLNQSGSSGIVTEIRHRANPLLTWLSWSSYLTSASALIIIFRAKYYQHMYETRSRYDNRYITKELRQLDLERSRQGRETVLPLNRREKGKYIKPTSFRLLEAEKVSLSRSIVFMVTTTFKLMIHIVADFSLFWILKIIRHHGKLQAPLVLQSPNTFLIQGSKPVASILRSMVDSVSPDFMSFSPNLLLTLPDPFPPDFERYGQIGILIFLLWFFALFEPYGLRLRHFVMGLYRPERAKARAVWLYHHILRTRAGFMKYARRKLHREYKYTSEAEHTLRNWLCSHIPFKWFTVDPVGQKCLLCNTAEYGWDADSTLVRCETPNCPGTFCTRCFSDIGQLCTICMRPADYGDLSDVSLEKGSSAESSDSENESLRSGRNKLAKFIHSKKKKYKKYLQKNKKGIKNQEQMYLLKSHSQKMGCKEENTYRNKANTVKHLKHLNEDLVKKNIGIFHVYCQECDDYANICNKKIKNMLSDNGHRALERNIRNKSCRLVDHKRCISSSSSKTENEETLNEIAKYSTTKRTCYSPSRKFKRKIKHRRDLLTQNLQLSEISSSLMKRRKQTYFNVVRKRSRRNQKLLWLRQKAIKFLHVSVSTIANSVSSNFTDALMKKRIRRRGKRYIKLKFLGMKMEFVIKKNMSSKDTFSMHKKASNDNPNNTETEKLQKNMLNSPQKSDTNTPQKGVTGQNVNTGVNKNSTNTRNNEVSNKEFKQTKKEKRLHQNFANKGQFKGICSSYWNNTIKKWKKSNNRTPEDKLMNFKRRKKFVGTKNMNQDRAKGIRDLKIESFFAGQEWVDDFIGADANYDTAGIRQTHNFKAMETDQNKARRKMHHYDDRCKETAGIYCSPCYGDATRPNIVCCERQGDPAWKPTYEYQENIRKENSEKWYHHLPGFNFFKSLLLCTQCSDHKKRGMEQREMQEIVSRRRVRQCYQSCVSPQVDRKQKNMNVAIARNTTSRNIYQGNAEIDATVPTCTCATQHNVLRKDAITGLRSKKATVHTKDANTLHFNAGRTYVMKDKSTLHFNCLKRTTRKQYHRQTNNKSAVEFEYSPTFIKIEPSEPLAPPSEDQHAVSEFEVPIISIKYEALPSRKKYKDPSTRIKCEDPPTRIKCEDPPTLIKCEDPPIRIKCEDPPIRIKCEDPPIRIKCEDPPIRIKCENLSITTNYEDPQAHLKFEDQSTRIEDSSKCIGSDTTGTQYHRQTNKKSVVQFEYPPKFIKIERPPSPEDQQAVLEFEVPPTLIKNVEHPSRKNYENQSKRMKYEDPPTRIKYEDPSTCKKYEDAQARLKFKDQRTRIEDSPRCIDSEASSKTQRIYKQKLTGNKSDTTVYKNQQLSKFSPGKVYKKINLKNVDREDKSTITEIDSGRDASTVTSDWWSPMEDKIDVAPLEKKRGTFLMSERKKHVKKLKNRGVWTEERTVKFKSNTQIIPPGVNTGSESQIGAPDEELLSPLRFLLESQKYYNELYTPFFYTPTSIMSIQKAEHNLLTRGVASEDNLSIICNYGT